MEKEIGTISPFNSALETGVRITSILAECYPNAHDLSRLVQYDYLTVHSADAGGPPSLHPPLPLRSGELLVRRSIIEAGLGLMLSRSLVRRHLRAEGFLYAAEEEAGAFLDNLKSLYIRELRSRAKWVAATFDRLSAVELDALVNKVFEAWTTEFQPAEFVAPSELF